MGKRQCPDMRDAPAGEAGASVEPGAGQALRSGAAAGQVPSSREAILYLKASGSRLSLRPSPVSA